MNQPSVSRRLASEPDFPLGYMTVSPSTGRVITLDEEIRVEALTMAVLVTLARAKGATLTRDVLVDECWQGRIVSDDAVARAVAKVRALERCTTPPPFTLETVPKVGYRLVTAFDGLSAPRPMKTTQAARWPLLRLLDLGQSSTRAGLLILGGVVVTAALIAALAPRADRPVAGDPLVGISQVADSEIRRPVRAGDVQDAVLALDEARLRDYLVRGWNPNWKLDSERNTALHNLMMACERNKAHDREGVVRVAKLLVEAGADPTLRNKWTDTPLIIASAKRYCGPDHPVVAYLQSAIADRAAGSR